jgi:hypothetical protein
MDDLMFWDYAIQEKYDNLIQLNFPTLNETGSLTIIEKARRF